jgi:hypothetical protein
LEAQKIIESRQQAEAAARLAQEQKSAQDAAARALAASIQGAQIAAIQKAVVETRPPPLKAPVGIGAREGAMTAMIFR